MADEAKPGMPAILWIAVGLVLVFVFFFWRGYIFGTDLATPRTAEPPAVVSTVTD